MNIYLSKKIKIISFVLMVMVVFIHSGHSVIKTNAGNIEIDKGYSFFVQEFIGKGLSSVAVPLFFLISGYLFFLNFHGTILEFRTKIQRRLKTLVFPYFFWTIWGIVFYYILQHIPFAKTFFTLKQIEDYTIHDFFSSIFLNPIPYQLWFLRDLILFIFLSPVLYMTIKYLNYFGVLFFFLTWAFDFNFFVFSNLGCFFFVSGAFISINKIKIIYINLSQKALTFVLIWVAFAFLNTALTYIEYNNPTLIHTVNKLVILAGIPAVWSIYDMLFKKVDAASYKVSGIFSFSFFLYVFHEPVLSIFKKGLFFIMGKGELISLIVYIITPLLTIFISIFAGYFIKRITPKFYDLITGGR